MAGYFLSKITFSKPSFSAEQLLDKLRERGLVIEDRSGALAYLLHVGGYRLKGYYYLALDPETKRFPEHFSFEDIVRLYEFDCALRAIAFQALERIEVSIRTTIANHLSAVYGPHWFLNHNLFKSSERWSPGKLLSKIETETKRSKSLFALHYQERYEQPYLPPSWAITECVSFGMWSLTYSHMKSTADQKVIATRFGVTEPEVFASWLHCLTVVRNAVAHHSRIVGTRFPFGPQGMKKAGLKFPDPHSFYSAATVMTFVLTRTRLPSRFKASLESLFAHYPEAYLAEIGFPEDWREQPGWR